MSTDYQQYSLDNQAHAISRYATDHDFLIVKTYSDAARSGLRLKNRAGLKQSETCAVHRSIRKGRRATPQSIIIHKPAPPVALASTETMPVLT
jgi:DNA invertase Pin-like site-specific DNA recombinase